MCGIVGYTGQKSASPFILSGLQKLEYRGYDSAGIATISKGDFMIEKTLGDPSKLKEKTKNGTTLKGNTGIGHNRWATHGKPCIKNAHPHPGKRFAIVHNGIIENEIHLKNTFLNDAVFSSDTDTEVVLLLLEKLAEKEKNISEAIKQLMSELKGSYALAILDKESPDTIYALKNKSPILIGCGDNFNMVGSDIAAMLENTSMFLELKDMEYAVVTDKNISIFSSSGEKITRKPFKAHIDVSDIQKGTYPHYMLKEIEEQPSVIRRLIKEYTSTDGGFKICDEIIRSIKNSDKIYIIGCGTSYHASLVGKFYFENIAQKEADAYVASEFIHNTPRLRKNPFFIFVSQSGETADLRAVLAKIKKLNYKCLTITNVPGSTLSRETDFTLPLYAGPEIAVASTKAYSAQIVLFSILATAVNNAISINLRRELAVLANVMESLCLEKEKYRQTAHKYLHNARNCFYIGRGLDYYVSLEASLKLKEVSYIHTEGFAAGELKHGPIALIEKGTPVIAFSTGENANHNTQGNIKEVKSRGANVVTVSLRSTSSPNDEFIIPDVHEFLTPPAAVIIAHFITYFAALERGCDIDKPRNLAKSVTVE